MATVVSAHLDCFIAYAATMGPLGELLRDQAAAVRAALAAGELDAAGVPDISDVGAALESYADTIEDEAGWVRTVGEVFRDLDTNADDGSRVPAGL